MPRLQRSPLGESKEIRRFPNGQLRIISLDDVTFGEFRLQPGWRWSHDVKPIAGTASCQHHHMGIILEGQLHVEMADGTSIDFLPGDAYEIPPGHDAWVVGDAPTLQFEFTGSRTFGVPPQGLGDGVIATLVFTDIVDSTATLSRVGDERWREMLLEHYAALRHELERFRGRELKTTGDGFLAAFDSASRAVRCALAMVEASRRLGLEIRVGCHTGEIVVQKNDAFGVAVHMSARVMSLAAAGEVLVSWTTHELLAGGDIETASIGRHALKGLQGDRELFRTVPRAG